MESDWSAAILEQFATKMNNNNYCDGSDQKTNEQLFGNVCNEETESKQAEMSCASKNSNFTFDIDENDPKWKSLEPKGKFNWISKQLLDIYNEFVAKKQKNPFNFVDNHLKKYIALCKFSHFFFCF